jgi:hypothetical protein
MNTRRRYAADAAAQPGGGRRGGAHAHTPAYWIEFSANQDGSFTVTNSRNGAWPADGGTRAAACFGGNRNSTRHSPENMLPLATYGRPKCVCHTA